MGKLTIQDLATLLVEKNGCDLADAQRFVSAIFDVIQMGVEHDKLVKVKGLGTFKVIDVEARESVSVNTGERVLINGHSKLSFTPDATMKELVNKPFSGFETVVLNEGVNFEDIKTSDMENNDDADVDIEDAPVVKEPEVVPLLDAAEYEKMSDERNKVVEEEDVNAAVSDVTEADVTEVEDKAAYEIVAEEKLADEKKAEKLSDDKAENEIIVEQKEPEIMELETAEPETPETEVDEHELVKTKETETSKSETIESENKETEEIEETEETMNNDYNPSITKRRIPYGLIVAILACAGCFAGGYYLGQSSVVPNYSIAEVIQGIELINDSVDNVSQDSLDSVGGDSTASHSILNEEPLSAPQPEEEKTVVEPKPAPAPQQTDYMKYESMDERVRTGAYYIMGTAEVVKAREGETLDRISRRILGQGMVCYLEVYNGIGATAPLKEGQEIKIPKIELKKIVKKRLEKNK